MSEISEMFVPLAITLSAVAILLSKRDCTAAFAEGASNGLTQLIKLFPTLLWTVTAVTVFLSSGIADFLTDRITSLFPSLNLPSSLYTLLLIRPFSGSASMSVFAELLHDVGPDSEAGRVASVITASSDTLFYTVAVYCGGVGIKKTRYLFPVLIITSLITTLLAFVLCRWI